MKSNRATSSAIIVGVIGGTLLFVGLGLFLSVFFSMANLVSDPTPFSGPPNIPFGRAVLGVVMFGIGGGLLKVALGLGLVGNAGTISGWLKDIVASRPSHTAPSKVAVKVRCPQCNSLNDENAKFCSSCGQKLS